MNMIGLSQPAIFRGVEQSFFIRKERMHMKKALTIAGSDCSGGAGIQADLKTFSALGVFGMSAIVSVVAENTCRVIQIHDIPVETIRAQIDAVYEDIGTDAVKIGMLNQSEIMLAVAEKLKEYQPKNIVLDPVMYAKGGCPLMNMDAIDTLIRHVLPLVDVVTPNIPEAEKIAGMSIATMDDRKKAAKLIYEMGPKHVIIKGGHSMEDACDLLYDGVDFTVFEQQRIDTKNTHGTGCTFSSAIAAGLARGMDIQRAVANAKKYITMAISHSLNIGKGHGPTNHFYHFYKECQIDEL